MQTISIETLGTDYNVIDEDGSLINTIKIVSQDEILLATLGEYSSDYYDDHRVYLQGCKDKLEGFVDDPYSVHWYRFHEEDFDLAEIINYSVLNGYKYVITELVPHTLTDNN